jgi:serine/threonine-protein kinase
LTVSVGKAGQEVPDLTGVSYRDAQVTLARAGLRVGRLVHTYSETVPKDAVVATDPERNSRVEPGARVDFLVSLGTRSPLFLLPNLVNRPVSEVRAFFTRSGIRLVERQRETFGVPAGQVLEQTPPPGSRIRTGELVEVAVSSPERGDWR